MSRISLLFVLLAVLVSLLLPTCCQAQRRRGGLATPAPTATGTPVKGPWFGVEAMKDAPAAWGVTGAVAYSVAIGSPADEAGMVMGDIITNIGDTPIRSAMDLLRTVPGLKSGQAYAVSLQRGKQALVLPVMLRERPAAGTVEKPAPRRLADMNVLTHAVIDPQSRVVTLIGKYDPAYPTGPIPYYDLLQEAMQSPYPYFSLEPTAETRAGVAGIDAAISADVQRMATQADYCTTWTNRLMGLLLNDPTLLRDRARLLKKGAAVFKISEEEMRKMFMKSLDPASVSYDETIPITGKVMLALGYTQVGEALLVDKNDSMAAFDKLGVKAEAEAILAKFHAGTLTQDRAKLEVNVLLVSGFLRGMRVPEADITSRANNVLNGRMTIDAFMAYMEERQMAILVDSVGVQLFNGLTLSPELLSKLYNVPTPRVNLVFKDVPADSLLGDTLFRADYAMKTICTGPDLKERIPGFLTEMDYLYAEAGKQGIRIPGDAGAEAGHRLIPGEVRMRVSPAGTLVAFDSAQVKIIGWQINPVGKRTPAKVAELIKNGIESYGDYLTGQYNALAGVYPELHRLREAEKLIALARWAANNHYKLVVENPNGVRVPQAPTATGFCQAVFTADAQQFSLTLMVEGGASFGKDEGEAWVKPTVNAEVSADVSKQLIMSTVLARQAADTAIGGDLEAARDLADKSARAMTGDIDLTKLPALGDIPLPGEPAQMVVLSKEALDATDQQLRAIAQAKVSLQKAADLAPVSAEDAAQMRAAAEQQLRLGTVRLQSLRDALDDARKNQGNVNDAVVAIRGLGKITPATVATTLQPGTTTTPATPAAKKDDITPEQRAKLLAELAKLQTELEATKAQFGKLNQDIQQDKQQFEDWGKVADDGMNRCTGILYSLLMDASAAQLAERYSTMHELAEKLPNHPQDLIDSLARTKNWFTAMSVTQTMKDVTEAAKKDGKTLPELLEEVRDDLNIIAGCPGIKNTVVVAAWKQGTNIVEMAFNYTQFSTAYDGINQMDKNNEGYRKAVVALTKRMEALVKRVKEIKADLGGTE